jgi:hypothetical protein
LVKKKTKSKTELDTSEDRIKVVDLKEVVFNKPYIKGNDKALEGILVDLCNFIAKIKMVVTNVFLNLKIEEIKQILEDETHINFYKKLT